MLAVLATYKQPGEQILHVSTKYIYRYSIYNIYSSIYKHRWTKFIYLRFDLSIVKDSAKVKKVIILGVELWPCVKYGKC
jgi:hypothetical protein